MTALRGVQRGQRRRQRRLRRVAVVRRCHHGEDVVELADQVPLEFAGSQRGVQFSCLDRVLDVDFQLLELLLAVLGRLVRLQDCLKHLPIEFGDVGVQPRQRGFGVFHRLRCRTALPVIGGRCRLSRSRRVRRGARRRDRRPGAGVEEPRSLLVDLGEDRVELFGRRHHRQGRHQGDGHFGGGQPGLPGVLLPGAVLHVLHRGADLVGRCHRLGQHQRAGRAPRINPSMAVTVPSGDAPNNSPTGLGVGWRVSPRPWPSRRRAAPRPGPAASRRIGGLR
ncbi:hypothetical protein C1Y40_05631 [Mycobacterium talmoniae]|uniref:Uncharacterized protein n=1 Tax=Mycobacterium talmoniae TaxID=1858794 RepID=A0A2S8BC30_9MYCO|nr:hypothetical protein C1Y40_05631 [Mycobacterium talmoniae]